MTYTRKSTDKTVSLKPVPAAGYEQWLAESSPRIANWLRAAGFQAKAGQFSAVPDQEGGIDTVVFGMQESGWLQQLSSLASDLPAGAYRLDAKWDRDQRVLAALGWGLAAYRFDRYRRQDKETPDPELVLADDIAQEVERLCTAQCLVRDLVNTPTEDMGPGQLAEAVTAEAKQFGASVSIIEGDELLERNYPAIHAVGRAAERAPRLISMQWGEGNLPLVALCGKGVCFDSGGLDIKSSRGMILMKKDMGGAAHVLALARLIMQEELPVRLSVLIPAVENAISGNAYRPGDVIKTRKGLTVEIGNTDAEGRVVLADALARACEDLPDLVLDFATLTGAARVAMGPDVPPIFSNCRATASALIAAGEEVEDPLWELPLYAPYRKMIDSDIADINNTGKSSYAGCITAALFLKEFVAPELPWVHVDTYAWNQTAAPGRPVGGEALGLRAAFRYLEQRYG